MILLNNFSQKICNIIPILCNKIVQLIADSKMDDDDPERFLVFISHYPAGTSLKSLLALSDSIRYQRFANLDTGIPYKLENIKNLPIFLFVGQEDRLATAADSIILKNRLGETVKFYREYPGVGHLSFFISKNNFFMKDIIDNLDRINGGSE